MLRVWPQKDKKRGGATDKDAVLAWAVTTKYHTSGGSKNRSLFSHSSGGWKSKIKVLVSWVSSELSPWLAGGHFHTVSFMVFPLCVRRSVSSSYKNTNHIGFI